MFASYISTRSACESGYGNCTRLKSVNTSENKTKYIKCRKKGF